MNPRKQWRETDGQGSKLRRCVSRVVVGVALAWCTEARSEVIVSDNFDTMTTEQSLTGRTPDVNLPGSSWVTAVNSGYALTEVIVGGNPGVNGVANDGSAILLDSFGAYTKPTKFRICADLRPNTVAGLASHARGLGLGFYKGVNVHPDCRIFSQGLILDGAGNLNLQQDYTFSTMVAYVGTWSATAYHRLSYDVDTATGFITNISLEGSAADYSSFYATPYFTDANTKYAGLYVTSETGGVSGEFDNLSVTTIPLPEPMAMVLAGLAGLCVWRARKTLS